LIKYAANAFLATKITFINEIADLCEQAGADVQEVACLPGATPADPATSLYIKTCQGTKPGVREDLLQSSSPRLAGKLYPQRPARRDVR
jgi:UDP-glucose/GDP-mannose dehydrogenase family protein